MTSLSDRPPAGNPAHNTVDVIADAIRDHDWPRVEFLLRQLVATDPEQAAAVYDTIQAGLEIARANEVVSGGR